MRGSGLDLGSLIAVARTEAERIRREYRWQHELFADGPKGSAMQVHRLIQVKEGTEIQTDIICSWSRSSRKDAGKRTIQRVEHLQFPYGAVVGEYVTVIDAIFAWETASAGTAA